MKKALYPPLWRGGIIKSPEGISSGLFCFGIGYLSMNTVSMRHSLLLEKTGTHSKREPADRYLKTIGAY